MAQNLLIKGGYVLRFGAGSTALDPRISFKVQDVLVQGNKIARIDDTITAPPGARVVDATDHIVSPGFIDTHRHLWQTAVRGITKPAAFGDQTLFEYIYCLFMVYRSHWTPQDMYWGQLAGACEAVSSGITTVLDHSHAPWSQEHIRRCIDATRQSGIRCVYAYTKVDEEAWEKWQNKHIREIGRELQDAADKRITLGLGYDSVAWEAPDTIRKTLATAKDAGSSLTTVHIVPTHFPFDLSAISNASGGLSSYVFSHMNHAKPDEMEMLQKLDAGISCTPETELAMGHGLCAAFDCAEQGIRAGLGIDTHAVCSGDMFAQMRLALQSARSTRHAALYLGTPGPHTQAEATGHIPRSLVHRAAHVLRFATLGGAEAMHMEDKIGSLEVGKCADLMLISLSSPNMLGVTPDDATLSAAMVVMANASDVKTVVVNGEVVKHDGELQRVQWADVVVGFRKQQQELRAKLKRAADEADWEEAEAKALKMMSRDFTNTREHYKLGAMWTLHRGYIRAIIYKNQERLVNSPADGGTKNLAEETQ